MSKRPIILWLILLGAILIAVAMMGQNAAKQEIDVPISDFVSRVEHGEVTKVTIAGDAIHGETAHGGVNTFATEKSELIKALHDNHVPYEEKQPSNTGTWMMLLLKLAVPLVIVLVIARGIKNAGPGGALKAQTSHKSKMQNGVKTTFADVAGIDEAVEECRDLVTFLKDPGKFSKLGGRVPKGVLLVGPPGNGKTLLARAVAGEAGVPFFAGSASEFVEMFVGVGAARVRDLFGNAKKHSPCIIFIDEIDAVGKKRTGLTGIGGHSEMEQTLNQILTEMDGFEQNAGVIVMAATNRPETLDQALTRSGRFDRFVVVPLPDVKGREAILKVHGRDKKMAPDVDYSAIARGTPGLVGSDLEKLMNEAALDAAKRGKEAIDTDDIERAKEKVFMGPERKSAVISDDDKNIVSWHESGHTVIGWFTPEADPPHRVSIIPRGMALGLTWSLPTEDRKLQRRSQLLAQIKVLLGGRAAEKIILKDDFTTGASNDIERASAIVDKMVKDLGMGKDMGPGTFGKKDQGFMFDHSQPDYSEDTARKIDDEKRRILVECQTAVDALIAEKREQLEALAETLKREETVTAETLLKLFGPRPALG